jgi:hypothetical protein
MGTGGKKKEKRKRKPTVIRFWLALDARGAAPKRL